MRCVTSPFSFEMNAIEALMKDATRRTTFMSDDRELASPCQDEGHGMASESGLGISAGTAWRSVPENTAVDNRVPRLRIKPDRRRIVMDLAHGDERRRA